MDIRQRILAAIELGHNTVPTIKDYLPFKIEDIQREVTKMADEGVITSTSDLIFTIVSPDPDDLEEQLRDIVRKMSKISLDISPARIREIVESEIEEQVDTAPDKSRLIDKYAHTFYGLKQGSKVDENYCRLYVSNVIDAARGKKDYI